MAVSLAVIALSFLGLAIAAVAAMGKLANQVKTIGQTVAGFQDDLGRTLKSVRQLTEQAQDLMVVVRQEVGAFADTSRRLRRKIVKGVDRIQEKLEELEALYDVVHEEVEDTALDVAAALRQVRQGNGVIGRVRRMLVPGR
jgi:uncharacterized protein YoxC